MHRQQLVHVLSVCPHGHFGLCALRHHLDGSPLPLFASFILFLTLIKGREKVRIMDLCSAALTGLVAILLETRGMVLLNTVFHKRGLVGRQVHTFANFQQSPSILSSLIQSQTQQLYISQNFKPPITA